MASYSTDKQGNRTIQFTGRDKRRKSIYLGKMPKRMVETIRLRVEELNYWAISGHTVSDDCAKWLASQDEMILDKLAGVGLIPKTEVATLGAFLEGYISGRTDVRPYTVLKYEATQQRLIDHFGEMKSLREITPGDADAFRLKLAAGGLAANTVCKYLAVCKLFFGGAIRKRLISTNPFAGLKSKVQANRSRDYFITADQAAKVLEACPDREWRLLFALARFGGLRIPSEILELRWTDINWELSRMTIRSPKTAHHGQGHESRIVPIFSELRPYLDECWEAAPPKAEFLIPRYRDGSVNLRTQLERIILKAGLKAWPKLWQNLRSTRATELAAKFPAHIAAEWLGHSVAIASRHYWQTTDADFAKAATEPTTAETENELAKSNAHVVAEALQNQTQQPTAMGGSALEFASEPLVGHGVVSKNPGKNWVSDQTTSGRPGTRTPTP